MNIVKISIERPVFAWILMFALILFGAISFNRLGISQMPDVDFPVLSISIGFDGASPEVVEAEILDKFEKRLTSLEGLKEIKSTARAGSASIQLEFDIKKNIDVALQEVQTAISQIRLPEGVTDAPVIRKSNPEEDPIMFMGFWSDKSIQEVIEFLEFTIIPGFQGIPGVGEVSIAGFSTRNLRIWVDLEKLKKFDFTVTDLIDSISQQHNEKPVGLVSNKTTEVNSRLMGEAQTVADFEMLPLLRRGGQIVHTNRIFRIKDFAKVEDGLSDVRRIAEVDGKNAVSLSVRKQRGTNEVAVAKKIRAHFDSLQSTLPKGFSSRINVDYTKSTEAVVNSTITKLLLAGIVTVLIVFLFLGSWSSCVNVLFSIPTSIVGTFTFMYFSGFTLNLFSLLALALVISIVIDDAIMILENIIRHFRMGKSPSVAAYDGTQEILGATLAATLAVIAVFVPVVFMDGVIGKFFFQFGIVMSIAVALSFLDAVTITPMRASQLLNSNKKIGAYERFIENLFHKIENLYRKSLNFSLKYSFTTLCVGLLVFTLSLMLFQKIKREFVPSQDQNFLIMTFQTGLESALEVTHQKGKEIASILNTVPEIQGYFISVGPGGQSTSANQGFVPLILKPAEERNINHLEIMNKVREKLKDVKGVRIQIRDVSSRGLTSGRTFPVSFNLRGPDLDILDVKAKEIIKHLEDRNLARELDTDYKKGVKELQILPRREIMAARGVSTESVAKTLQVLVGGMVVGQFTQDGRRFDIRMKGIEGKISGPEDIKKIYVRNIVGNMEPLSQLVDIKETQITQSINRINRQRSLSVFGNLGEGQSQAKVLEEVKKISDQVLPPGYQVKFEGAASQLEDSFKSIGFALILGLLVAYMILAIQYNSFIHPVTVLMALPFALSGALLTLWIFENSMNLFSLIGLIVLMGIAKKNSILLVEFTNQTREKDEKIKIKDALVLACPVRLRPILMTSIATLVASLPLVVKGGMGHEATSSMALAIIGGVLISTFFTLYIIPVVYYYFSFLESKQGKVSVIDN